MDYFLNLTMGVLIFCFISRLFLFILQAGKAHEKVAIRRAFLLVGVSLIPLSFIFIFPEIFKALFLGIIAGTLFIILVSFTLPIGRIHVKHEIPLKQYDERDIPFSRFLLEPGTKRFNEYYKDKSKLRTNDDKIRKLPGLLSINAQYAHPLAFASASASFQFTTELRYKVNGGSIKTDQKLIESASKYSRKEITNWIKRLAHFYGAHSTGVTELKKYHLYSHIGRGSGKYGEKVKLNHTYAIAITVEMRNEQIQQGPGAAAVMESAREYAYIAHIAFQITSFIRALGYSARSHIDGNYRVICPLVARDAGLGEIGRLGLLITPDLGPRVRIAVVTTDMELIPDLYKPDASVIDFCNFCTKCADVCPVGAIPIGQREEHNGALKWQLKPDACYAFWNLSGTDCGRCMAVCPYSHSPLYNTKLTRFLVKRSGFARRLLLLFDNYFYGRKPKPHKENFI